MFMQTRRIVMAALAAVTAAALLAAPAGARDRFAAIPTALQPLVDRNEIAGAVALVATKDKVLHTSAVGVSALETRRPMRTDDIFWIASMSKPVGAIALGILKDEGKLDWDDAVSKYVPEFAAIRSPDGKPVTLRQLLTHTGGLGEQMARQPHLTVAQTATMAAEQPLKNPVGAKWSYSTLGIDVLCRVAEVASGMPYDRFVATRILHPLGMKDTGFWIAPGKMSRYAHTYRRNAAGTLDPTPIPYLYGTEPTDRGRPALTGAGLFSTAGDIARVYQMMLNGGSYRGHRILKPETVAEITRKQTVGIEARPGMPWGLGIALVEEPAKTPGNAKLAPGSFGHGGAFGTSSYADPSRGIVYVLMLERAGLPSGDSSDMRIAFMNTATAALDAR